jgi:hypothetical protein
MSLTFRVERGVSFLVAVALIVMATNSATAQEGGRRGRGFGRFFIVQKVSLAQLKEVQEELKLSDELKEKVTTLNDDFSEQTRTVFEEAEGDRDKMREGFVKVQQETNAKLDELLDEKQRRRLQEIYIQVNGSSALQDEAVASALKISEEQQEKLEESRDASRQEFMDAGLRDLDDEARTKKMEELNKSRDEKALAVLTEEQGAAFEKMKGDELEIDLSQLRGFGRGGGQGRRDTT